MEAGRIISIAPSLTGVLLLENRFLAAAAVVSVHFEEKGGGRCIRESDDSCTFEELSHPVPALV